MIVGLTKRFYYQCKPIHLKCLSNHLLEHKKETPLMRKFNTMGEKDDKYVNMWKVCIFFPKSE